MNRINIAFLLTFCFFTGYSQSNWDGKSLTIENEELVRKVILKNGQLSTRLFLLKNYPYNFVSSEKDEPLDFKQEDVGQIHEFRRWRGPNPAEFSFLLNGEKVSGKTGWELVNTEETRNTDQIVHKIILKETQKLTGIWN